MDIVEVGLRLLAFSTNTGTLERVLSALSGAVHEASRFLESIDDDELQYLGDEEFDVIESVLGTSFVACQAQMNGVIARVEQVQRRARRSAPETTLIDGRRTTLLDLTPRKLSGLSHAHALWHLANYFKHSDQWGPGWRDATDPQSKLTIKAIESLGLTPGSTGNLRTGADQLGLKTYADLDVLLKIVEDWQVVVVAHVRQRLGRN